MKKFLLVLAAMLLFSMTVRAEIPQCSGYWNSIDKECNWCSASCSRCHEWLYRLYRGSELQSAPSCDRCDAGYKRVLINTPDADGPDANNMWPGGTGFYRCERDTPVCPSNCSSCSDSSTCTSCNDGYTLSNGKCVASVSCDSGSVEIGGTCVKAATCTYPLKEVADYSGECAGCCTD